MGQLKQGYKQMDIGVIPEDWEVKKLGDIGEPIIGLTYKPENVKSEGILVLRSSNIQENKLSFDDNVFVNVEVSDRIITRNGDILICVRNGSRELIGKSAIIKGKAVGQTFGAFMSVYRTEYSNYVSHLFNSELIKKQIDQHLGATINQITNKSLSSFNIPLPPTLFEQTAIASALSDIDALISALDKKITKKQRIKQGAMQQLLTGKIRLAGYSGEWKNVVLSDIVDDFIVPMRDKPKNLKGNIPWCRIEDFNGMYLWGSQSEQGIDIETVKSMNLKIYPVGTLLVSCSAYLGRCAIVGKELVTNQTFIGLFPSKKCNVEFLYYAMKREEKSLNSLSSGTTISYLSREQFESYPLFIPSKSEQTSIAKILTDMDDEISQLEADLNKYKQIKAGMMQQLLTGKIRLVN